MSAKPICLIIGAGDYIGAAIAKRFAKGGFHVVMGRRRGELFTPLIAEIEAAGGAAQGFTWDARKEEAAIEMFAMVENDIGPIEICVFNVGGNVRFPILETTERVFRKVWEMCGYAAFLSGREAAKYMVAREKGSIFFTGATASIREVRGLPLSRRASSRCGAWRNPWPANWVLKIFMSRIWSSTPGSILNSCASASVMRVLILTICRLTR